MTSRTTNHEPRITTAYHAVRARLLSERTTAGHWEGELSTSALSTAVAVLALDLVRRSGVEHHYRAQFDALIAGGLEWLASHQNEDGGWGDTIKSVSNISTTMLAHATCVGTAEFQSERSVTLDADVTARSQRYIDAAGGVPAIRARYGKDKTFSIPILTHCALAGLIAWDEVSGLPFELARLPHRFYSTIKLPVVSYALPALIAIGQVRHFHKPTWNPITRLLRNRAVEPTLAKLITLQPENGGFLEATPLTAFVTMSLAGMERASHPVARKGVDFLVNSVRPDGSWPIDTNLATWVTTLTVNALKSDLPDDSLPHLQQWLLGQQYRDVHPFTQAAPGGWSWTDLPGGVPDADDTPGALLALMTLHGIDSDMPPIGAQLTGGVRWLCDLQNRDGGIPTFCRGWGTLPFDRSSPDLTAHTLRALHRWRTTFAADLDPDADVDLAPGFDLDDHLQDVEFAKRADTAITRGLKFLSKVQRDDGSWLPLWFGNQHAPDDINPVYGTSRVVMMYRDLELMETPEAVRGVEFLTAQQNDDGGWSGVRGGPSSIEETSLAVEALHSADPLSDAVGRGLDFLCDYVQRTVIEADAPIEPSPIGFYFAKLWYFERLYPTIFLASALRVAYRERSRIAT